MNFYKTKTEKPKDYIGFVDRIPPTSHFFKELLSYTHFVYTRDGNSFNVRCPYY